MAAVQGRDTKPELAVRTALSSRGLQFRICVKDLPGSPVIVLSKHRAVVFVHGCFWHGHDCRRGSRTPKSNTAYWIAKIARNRSRDASSARRLRAAGWRVFTIWTCRDVEKSADRIARALLADRMHRRKR